MRNLQPIIFSLTALLLSTFSYGQNWEALNPPSNIFNGIIHTTSMDDSGNVYVAGDFKNSNNNRFVAKWNGDSWIELGAPGATLNANYTILTMAKGLAGNIYAAGGFTNAVGNYYVARWNGSGWSELSNGNSALNANGLIYSVVTDKSGNVYAAGAFTNAEGKCYVAKWNGSSWSEVGSGANVLNANNTIFAITVDSSGNIYAAGYFTNSSGNVYVAKWDGSSWSETGAGANSLFVNNFITCLAADNNGNIYAGGDFINSNYQYYMARWNGSTWSEMGTGNNALSGRIQTIAINSASEVYAAGYFTNAIGNNYVAKWNGVLWVEISNAQSILQANDPIHSIQVDANNNIYAGGQFINKSKRQFIAKWNGTVWNEPGYKGDPFLTNQRIYKIAADSGRNVYVSGDLVSVGGFYSIAHWNGTAWNEMHPEYTGGISLIGGANNMAIDKLGNIYAAGFANDGYKCILKWDGSQWSKLEDYPNSLHPTGPVSITDIQTDNSNNVYVSGSFSDSTFGLCSLAKWDGKKWTRLPGSLADYISNFCVANDGNIYAFGAFGGSGGYYIANYNYSTHQNWKEVRNADSIGLGVPGQNVFISIATDNKNNLYVNGHLEDKNGKRYLGKWDGKNWSKFGFADNLGTNLAIDSSGNIYTSGTWTYVGDSRVKKWTGTSWIGVGAPLLPQDVAPEGTILATDPNGNVYSDASLAGATGTNIFIAKFGRSESSQSPKILSFKPTSGSLGSKIIITGKNFTGTTSVNFGGTQASSFSINNDSTITAFVGKGATGSVKIQTLAGSDSLQKFTYTCDSINTSTPTISSLGDTILLSTNANYYQWYFNNKKIDNQISNSLHVNKAGFYHVETSPNNVCWISSADYPVLFTQDPLTDSLKINIYPNPSDAKFTVDIKLPQTTSVTAYVTIYDLNGVQVLQTNKLIFFGNEVKIPITLNTKGTFFVRVFVNGDSRQQVVIII